MTPIAPARIDRLAIPHPEWSGAGASVGWTGRPSTRPTPLERLHKLRLNAWTGNPSTLHGIAAWLLAPSLVTVGLAAAPPTRPTGAGVADRRTLNASAAKLPTLRGITAALLFAPALALAQQDSAAELPVQAPAPAAQQDSADPRRPGETTTGRPPASARPAPVTAPAAPAPQTAPLPGDTAAPAATPAPTAPIQPQPAARPAPQVSLPATPPATGGLLQTILALLLVLGLLAGLAWFLKKYGPKASGGSANLRVVGALNLGGRERIMVVEVGDQWIVVGAAPGRVNALHTMPRQEGAQTLGTAGGIVGGAGASPAASFSDWLKKTIDKRNAT